MVAEFPFQLQSFIFALRTPEVPCSCRAADIILSNINSTQEVLITYLFRNYFSLKQNAKLRALRKTLRDLELFKQRAERVNVQQDEARKKYFAAQAWALKIVEILKENNKPMTRGQILAKILEYEPELKRKWAQPENRLSKILSNLVSSEIIERIQKNGTTGFYYFLPDQW